MDSTTTTRTANEVASAEAYQQWTWSSYAKYGAKITWTDGTTTSCGHSHKSIPLAEKCLARWLHELANESGD